LADVGAGDSLFGAGWNVPPDVAYAGDEGVRKFFVAIFVERIRFSASFSTYRFLVPEGPSRIAQRFIAGSRFGKKSSKPRRDGRS